jgi:hypothetical protein|tara:strand:- start:4621 stop:4770 length:150 start_codon:yes stop_codon:yes gene_type:complete
MTNTQKVKNTIKKAIRESKNCSDELGELGQDVLTENLKNILNLIKELED